MTDRALAESVLLRSIEDLGKQDERSASIAFFTGPAFIRYARLAGIGIEDRIRLLSLALKAAREIALEP